MGPTRSVSVDRDCREQRQGDIARSNLSPPPVRSGYPNAIHPRFIHPESSANQTLPILRGSLYVILPDGGSVLLHCFTGLTQQRPKHEASKSWIPVVSCRTSRLPAFIHILHPPNQKFSTAASAQSCSATSESRREPEGLQAFIDVRTTRGSELFLEVDELQRSVRESANGVGSNDPRVRTIQIAFLESLPCLVFATPRL